MSQTPSSSSGKPVRVRFAPSPTGFLHIGGVRAALFNWLYARHFGGQFLLRIEDTDLERSETRYTDDILSSMKWLGLNWDEEPIFQSKRLPVYTERAEELIKKGFAYRCYCTEAEVEAMRDVAMKAGKKPMYDRTCRDKTADDQKENISKGLPSVIRAKIPLTGHVEFHDLIRGDVKFENTEIDDFVLIRSNGAPTYNLSVVVDDVHSKMTHIIRGDDHINNTPKQLHLYRFLDYPLPLFAHLPMILGADKKKLSKRHGAVSANIYRAEGYLPEAMLNFLARLGWSHGDQEEFTVDEMIKLFDFDHVQKASGVFNVEKLLWLNGVYIRKASAERLLGILSEDCKDQFTPESLARAKTPTGEKLVGLIKEKVKLVKEIAEQLAPLCQPGVLAVGTLDSSSLKLNKDENLKAASKAAVKQVCIELSKKIEAVGGKNRDGSEAAWGNSPSLSDAGLNHTDLDAILRQIGERNGVKLGDLMQPMRLAVTGKMVSASLFDLLVILPWDVAVARLAVVEAL